MKQKSKTCTSIPWDCPEKKNIKHETGRKRMCCGMQCTIASNKFEERDSIMLATRYDYIYIHMRLKLADSNPMACVAQRNSCPDRYRRFDF